MAEGERISNEEGLVCFGDIDVRVRDNLHMQREKAEGDSRRRAASAIPDQDDSDECLQHPK